MMFTILLIQEKKLAFKKADCIRIYTSEVDFHIIFDNISTSFYIV